jgi:hypothetical protein
MNFNEEMSIFFIVLLIIVILVYIRDMYYAQKRHEELILRADKAIAELKIYAADLRHYAEEIRKHVKTP